MEAIYRDLDLARVAGKTVAQALLDTEIPLPAGREVGRVLHVEGEVNNEGARCAPGRVEADGNVRLQVLCLPPEGGMPFGLSTVANYRQDIPMPEAEEGMRATVVPQLQELNCRAENGRLKVDGIVDLFAVAKQHGKIQALQDVSGVKKLQRRMTTIDTSEMVPFGASTLRLREVLPTPGMDAKSILLQNAAAQVRGLEKTPEGAALNGRLSVNVLLADQDGQMRQMTQHYPFEELVPWQGDMADIPEEDLRGNAIVRDLTVTPGPEDGLDVEAALGLMVDGLRRDSIEALNDAFAPDGSFMVQQQEIEQVEQMGAVTKVCNIREFLRIPDELPEAYQSVYTNARPLVTGTSDMGGQLAVDGVLFASVVFQTDEGGMFGFAEDIPFQCVLDAPYTGDAEVSARVMHGQVTGEGRMPEVTYSMEVTADILQPSLVSIAVDAEEAPPAQRPTGILIYLAKEGESLWDVARQFGLTEDQIRDWNPGITEPLSEGQQLLLLSNGGR